MTDYTRELKIAELIVRQEIGELDTAEQQALSQWLEESEAHAALYRFPLRQSLIRNDLYGVRSVKYSNTKFIVWFGSQPRLPQSL